MYEGNNIQRRQNAALLLEEIKQEVDNFDGDGPEGIASKAAGSAKRLATADGYAASGGLESGRTMVNQSLKLCKLEEDVLADGGESTFSLFASLLDSALQGRSFFVEIS